VRALSQTANAAELELGGVSARQEGDAWGSRQPVAAPSSSHFTAVTDRKEGSMYLAVLALCTAELVAAIALYRASTKR
jgi:hypothetical protein